jgi:predicted N-acetyltransferase YhbS
LTWARGDLICAALAEAHGHRKRRPWLEKDRAVALTQRAGVEPSLLIEVERPEDAQAVDKLVDQAFGPGRFVKTAERLREGSQPIAGLSFVARLDGEVIGTVRLWPVEIAGVRAAFLGPIAVDRSRRSEGLGALLVERACAAAEAGAWPAVLLVGDEPYFGRFGFKRVKVALPGPVDPRRVLLRELTPGALLPLIDAGGAEVRRARD